LKEVVHRGGALKTNMFGFGNVMRYYFFFSRQQKNFSDFHSGS